MTPIEITSTTDSADNVQAALGQKTDPAPAVDQKDSAGKSASPAAQADPGKKEAQAKDTGAKEAKEVDPENDDDTGASDADDTEADEAESKEAKDDTAGEKPKRKNGWQRKVDKLTARVSAERQRAELLEARLSQLEQSKRDSNETKSTQASAAPAGDPKDPEPTAGDFETAAEYTKALSSWQYRQDKRADEIKSKESKAGDEFRNQVNAHQARVNTFAESHEDFQDAMDALATVPNSPALAHYIVNSENGPAILYELAKNPEDASRIAKLSPVALVRELAKVEVRLEASQEKKQAPPKEEAKPKSKAPKPLEPVGSKGATSTSRSLDEIAATGSQKEYEAARAKQRAEAARAG